MSSTMTAGAAGFALTCASTASSAPVIPPDNHVAVPSVMHKSRSRTARHHTIASHVGHMHVSQKMDRFATAWASAQACLRTLSRLVKA